MTVVVELKDGTELFVPDIFDPTDGQIETTKDDVQDFIVDRVPIPILFPLITFVPTRVDMFNMKTSRSYVIDYTYVAIDPSDVKTIRNIAI